MSRRHWLCNKCKVRTVHRQISFWNWNISKNHSSRQINFFSIVLNKNLVKKSHDIVIFKSVLCLNNTDLFVIIWKEDQQTAATTTNSPTCYAIRPSFSHLEAIRKHYSPRKGIMDMVLSRAGHDNVTMF